ncbi:MAG: FecR/PupR family sigma factor regulator [Pseudomonadota bacterium]|jgi:ferric-dicitrate binding protein FerR (iron transport regulator)|uniref:FecR/PupR family sigma factor regulator n=1 Tax=Burkholderiaceae TaxID=119060 RepID=UPI0010F55413|nr:FecR/PupR family sigma factor regulator [Burkholderia sp. 4M9327F10]
MEIPDACLSRNLTAVVSERICEGAIHWLFWLRTGGATPADLTTFRRWRAQSDEHARVAYEVIWIWNALGVLADPDYVCCINSRGSRNLGAVGRKPNHTVRASLRRMRRAAHALLRRRSG